MDDLELIKQKINIVDLIQEYLPLKKSGVNFKANCPFHNERTPSFMVSPERGIWHCFGCNLGGDIFKFLMEKEGLDFKESLDILAKKAGITLKNKPKESNTLTRIYEINQKAKQFYHYILTEHPLGKNALDYLKQRGVIEKTIKEFFLGYAPLNWEILSSFLKKRGFSNEELVSSGIAISSKKSLPVSMQGCYDRFRGRVTFPLIDSQDRVVGFSGRILSSDNSDSGPKYINTPQTAIFDKSKFLFGLNLSKGEIKQQKEAILVEGEMDMIISFQSGIKNIVACKGSALTEGHVELIKKFAQTLALCFDTDLAGDFAARRGIEIADQAGLDLKVIQISGAKDPADLCLKEVKLWEKAVADSIPIYDYYLKSVRVRYDIKSSLGKRGIFAELLPIWQKITDPMTKEHYIQKLAALLGVKDDFIRQQMTKRVSYAVKTSVNLDKAKDDKLPTRDRRKLLEEYLLAMLLRLPANTTYVPNFPETLFTQESLRQIYVLLVLFLDTIAFKGKAFKIVEFVKTLPPELVAEVDKLYLISLDEKLLEESSWQKELDSVITELKKMLIKASLEKLSLEIKNAQEFDKIETLGILSKKFRDLSLKLKNL